MEVKEWAHMYGEDLQCTHWKCTQARERRGTVPAAGGEVKPVGEILKVGVLRSNHWTNVPCKRELEHRACEELDSGRRRSWIVREWGGIATGDTRGKRQSRTSWWFNGQNLEPVLQTKEEGETRIPDAENRLECNRKKQPESTALQEWQTFLDIYNLPGTGFKVMYMKYIYNVHSILNEETEPYKSLSYSGKFT